MDMQGTNYNFADLPRGAVNRLQELESKLLQEFGEEITLIAYTKKGAGGEVPACRADLKGD